MTGYEFGDVILVPFPFTDQSTSKRRPAVVATIDRNLVLRTLGRLEDEDRAALREVLGQILGS